MKNIEKYRDKVEKELLILSMGIKIAIKNSEYDNQSELATDLGISEPMLSYCINFQFDNNGNLKGSYDVWERLDNILGTKIISKLKNLGLLRSR